MKRPRIVLASASPRRRALLAERGLSFEVRPVEVDEDLASFSDPSRAARELARRKALAAAARERPDPDEVLLVIGSDTVVAAPIESGAQRAWRLLGKPADEAEAREMLESLSGTRHQVVSGVCVARAGAEPALELDSERTWVSMRVLEAPELEAYVASGEWRDKAGGYAIQENADAFVTALEEGGFDNVVGLPVELTLRLLGTAAARAGVRLELPAGGPPSPPGAPRESGPGPL